MPAGPIGGGTTTTSGPVPKSSSRTNAVGGRFLMLGLPAYPAEVPNVSPTWPAWIFSHAFCIDRVGNSVSIRPISYHLAPLRRKSR